MLGVIGHAGTMRLPLGNGSPYCRFVIVPCLIPASVDGSNTPPSRSKGRQGLLCASLVWSARQIGLIRCLWSVQHIDSFWHRRSLADPRDGASIVAQSGLLRGILIDCRETCSAGGVETAPVCKVIQKRADSLSGLGVEIIFDVQNQIAQVAPDNDPVRLKTPQVVRQHLLRGTGDESRQSPNTDRTGTHGTENLNSPLSFKQNCNCAARATSIAYVQTTRAKSFAVVLHDREAYPTFEQIRSSCSEAEKSGTLERRC